ncbi:MAG: hypothetical protein GY786_16175 [Proteobacteria bacterium]|nr:hypothetical protein [Pseudomonadota bacterium]
MHKKLTPLSALRSLGLISSVDAVESTMEMTEGSVIYTCEIRGVAFRVSVKHRRGEVYSVFSRGRGMTDVAGPVRAKSIEDAARIACGEK